MAIEAWFMEDNDEDQRLPHHSNPKEFLDPNIYENDKELQKNRQERGYNYMDLLDLCHANMENYEQPLRNFYIEHIHVDEEIRYCLEESGYFDVRDKEDRWIQIWIKPVVVNIWNLKDYSCAITVPTYEALESVCTFGSASPFVSCLSSFTQKNWMETINSSSIQFVTVGERGVVRILNSDGAVLLFEQKSSDLAVSSKKEEVKRGFTSAMMLPLGQGLLCATVDLQFLIYGVDKHADAGLNLFMRKTLIGYNEEIADMKFLGEEEQFLAVATSVEQVAI
ncbi:hypothetical protein OROMI_016214 [Orobanche minor]